MFTRALELDERVEKAIQEQKAVAHTILRAGEHVKKKVRVYIQSEHYNQTAPGAPPTGKGLGFEAQGVGFAQQRNGCWRVELHSGNVCPSESRICKASSGPSLTFCLPPPLLLATSGRTGVLHCSYG